jgi:hypothetical protein
MSGGDAVTESEWLACTDPTPMLDFLRGKASDRKLRLFACACCRRFWHLLVDSRSQQAVEMSERFADALAGPGELTSAWEEARSAGDAVARQIDPGTSFDAARAVRLVCASPLLAVEQLALEGVALACAGQGLSATTGECQAQTDLLRCLFGNPFRPVTLDAIWRRWHGGLLVSMAGRIYDARDFTDMTVLADALEEAGCTDSDILNHCRRPGVHTRGCWVLDLLLGKE